MDFRGFRAPIAGILTILPWLQAFWPLRAVPWPSMRRQEQREVFHEAQSLVFEMR